MSGRVVGIGGVHTREFVLEQIRDLARLRPGHAR
jgi:hypothetical protein